MADKRKDSRGIVLQQGESQNAAGRYRYRYFDDLGLPHDVYSWRLRPEDPVPEGKKPGASLRELEKEIKRDLEDNLKSWQANTTVNSLVREYIKEQSNRWAASTLNVYTYTFETHIKPEFGKKKVAKLSFYDIYKFYSSLIQKKENPLKINTVCAIDKILKPALQNAVRKNIIRNNPAIGVIGQIKRDFPEKKQQKKRALEEAQQAALLEFVKEDNVYMQYYPIFYMLAWTGCRINELLALAWQDVDFQNEIIHIRRSLSYKKVDGKYIFILKEPKTENGVREIPMLAGVKRILKEMQEFSGRGKVTNIRPSDVSLKNKESFVFRNYDGNLYQYTSINFKLKRIVEKYNRMHKEKIPDISCHTFRHSFCCWLCENVEGSNTTDDLKFIQSILGHSDASTTLNIYAECRKGTKNSKTEALKKRSFASE